MADDIPSLPQSLSPTVAAALDVDAPTSPPDESLVRIVNAPPLNPTVEETKPTAAADLTIRHPEGEESVVSGSEKPAPARPQKLAPESQVSFKEESNVVADLFENEHNALLELKQLVGEAIASGQLSPKPVGGKEAKSSENKELQLSTVQVPNESTSDDTRKGERESIPPASAVTDADVEKPVETAIEVNSKTLGLEFTAEVTKSLELVSIWGIPLLEDDRSDAILLKFLRARDFKVKEAFIMLKNTLQWRKEFQIDELIEEDLGDDMEKLMFLHGRDRDGHPVCYNVFGELQNKELYHKILSDEAKRLKFIRWLVQFLENIIRTLDFSPGGVTTLFQVNDLKNSPGPGKREFRLATNQALRILQDNYPEFVAKQVFINVPWWYVAFYTMMGPFLTQRSKSKFVLVGPSKSAQTLFKYIYPEQVPIQYGGLSVDSCDCNPEFSFADPVTDLDVKPTTKQVVEIIVSEKCVIVWEIRVVGWEVSYGAEFVPNAEDSYTVLIHKATKMSPKDEPVILNSYKIDDLGKIVLTIDNPTTKKKKLLYRFKVIPISSA